MGRREGIDSQDAILCRLSHQLPQPEKVLHFTSPSLGSHSTVNSKHEFMSETYVEGNGLLQYFNDLPVTYQPLRMPYVLDNVLFHLFFSIQYVGHIYWCKFSW